MALAAFRLRPVGALLALILFTDNAGALELAPCELPQLNRAARCGTLEVPENPDQPDGRRIPVAIAVVTAHPGPARSDPIAVLMGGPGEDAISAAAIFAGQFAPLLNDRDLLLVDQRGTGRSGALTCDLFAEETALTTLRDLYPPRGVKRCAEQLKKHADPAQYTFLQFAGDLERVRLELGYDSLNISAGSYGTRAAQVYLRRYPRSVRTVHLASVVPIDIPPPLTMAKTLQNSLDDLFTDCAEDLECRRAYPQLRKEFRELVHRLDLGKAGVTMPGGVDAVPLDRGRVMEWFRSQLYRPATAASVPWLIHRANQGDWQPVAEGILAYARAFGSAASTGVFFSVSCSEDLAFVTERDIKRETKGTVLGDFRVRQQQVACRQWPLASLPEGYRATVSSSVPTLFVSGDTDAASPLWFTRHVAQGFSNRAEVVLGGRGHTEWSPCLAGIYERFVRGGEARGLDTSGCAALPRPPFRTQ